jgi:uncharacterized protein
MSVGEAGRLSDQIGGQRAAQTYGREFYEEIGHKGGQKIRKLIRERKEHENE